MKVRKKLAPGQPGTKKYLQRYGDKLICVRYRYDEANEQQLVTLELVVSKKYSPATIQKAYIHPHPNHHVLVEVAFHESELRTEIKRRGGVWLKDKRMWKMPYHLAEKLRLKPRIKEVDKPA